ncbi:MAG: SDR family NAD(P)-dependent oxidoreductase, partial [Kangiellaceae bacterium]|nr:SDR family NAD(P)-dependent oxidoreductase [Kangiellaceae bacterium]
NLGPSFQVLQDVYNNEHEVLGELKLPDIADSKIDDFVLHPSLIDGSLQAAMAAKIGQEQEEMFVPYSIGEVEILAPLEHECYTYVKEIEDPNSKVSKANVFVLNREGKVLVKIKESIGVPLTDVHEKPSEKASDIEFSELYYSFSWEETSIPAIESIEAGKNILVFTDNEALYQACQQLLESLGKPNGRLVFANFGKEFKQLDESRFLINPQRVEDYNLLFTSLSSRGWDLENLCFDGTLDIEETTDDNLEEKLSDGLETGVYALLSLSKSLAEQKLVNKISLNYFFSHRKNNLLPHQEAIAGFTKTLEIENSKVLSKVIEFESEKRDFDRLAQILILESNINSVPSTVVRYKDKKRYVRDIEEIDIAESETLRTANAGIKQQGTYLITGGAGGLGFIFAEHLAKEHQSKLILVGRSAVSKNTEDKLTRIKQLGGDAIYLECDISNPSEVKRLIEQSQSKFGGLNGILHSAGVLRDSYIKNKTKPEMEAVFGPKVYGTHFLDEATKHLKLDFFVTFSSMAAVGGNAGQCDYSFANHYMDSFVKQRERLQIAGKRHGKSLSINRSLWADGGMKLDEQTELFFKKNLGIHPLRTETGVKAFETGLNGAKTQFIIVEGDKQKIEKAWGLGESNEVAVTTQQANAQVESQDGASSDLALMVQDELAQMVMDFLKLDPEDMDLDKILLDLGFDSIGLTTYANLINEKYGLDVTPVLFFEYPSIKEIAKHLAVEHQQLTNRFHFGEAAGGQNDLPANESVA